MTGCKNKSPSIGTGVRGLRDVTDHEDKFARRFAAHGNMARAYREAEYKPQKTCEKDSRAGWDVLQRPAVQAKYEHYLAIQKKKLDVSDNRLLAEIASIAFVDPSLLQSAGGGLAAITDLPEHVRRAVRKVKVKRTVKSIDRDTDIITSEEIVEYEFHDKMKALTQLVRINGLEEKATAPKDITVTLKQGGRDGA